MTATTQTPERGAIPRVPPAQRRMLRLIRTFTSPLAPDDYLELINPLWSTRELRGRVVHVHCSRTREGVVFARELISLGAAANGYELHLRITGEQGRLAPRELDRLCPDWRQREAFVCGPPGLIDAMTAHWSEHGERERLHLERFTPEGALGEAERGCGGKIRLLASGIDACSDGEQPILVA